MKNLFAAGLVLASSLAFAGDIQVERNAQPVRVNSVQLEIVGEQGFPQTQVSVSATFSNKCRVPHSDELVQIVQHSKDFRTLNITLGEEGNRICPAIYQPTTVTIDLGTFTKPNDGLFSKVTVNGKSATR